MNTVIWTIATAITITGLLLILNPSPKVVTASSCSQQAAVHGAEEHGSGSSQGSCAISSAVHANPATGGGIISLNDHGSSCSSLAASRSGADFVGGTGSCSAHSPWHDTTQFPILSWNSQRFNGPYRWKVGSNKDPPVVTTDFPYLRRIGDRIIHERDFGRIQIDRIVDMQKWAGNIKSVEDELVSR